MKLLLFIFTMGSVCLNFTFIGAFAKEEQQWTADNSNPKTLGWMEGFPPPTKKLITQQDSNFFSFPKMRWTVCHFKELLPTEQVSRGLSTYIPFEYALDTKSIQILASATGLYK